VLARATVAFAAETVGTARRLVAISGSDPGDAVDRAARRVRAAAGALDRGTADRRPALRAAVTAAGAAATRAADEVIRAPGGARSPGDPDRPFFVRRAYGAATLLDPAVRIPERLPDPPD
jgi:hypothetical protein